MNKLSKILPISIGVIVLIYFVVAFMLDEKNSYIWLRLKDIWPYILAAFGVLESWVGMNKLKEKNNVK